MSCPRRRSGDELRGVGRGRELRTDGVGRHGLAEEMALAFVTALHSDLPHLIFRFDTLRHHDFVEAGAKAGNRSDDRLSVVFFPKAANERLVDLDLLEGKFAQVVE